MREDSSHPVSAFASGVVCASGQASTQRLSSVPPEMLVALKGNGEGPGTEGELLSAAVYTIGSLLEDLCGNGLGSYPNTFGILLKHMRRTEAATRWAFEDCQAVLTDLWPSGPVSAPASVHTPSAGSGGPGECRPSVVFLCMPACFAPPPLLVRSL
jgi:hypothetical protein